MREHAETFHAKKGYKLAHTFYINIAISEYNFLVHLINVFCMKTRLWTPIHFT